MNIEKIVNGVKVFVRTQIYGKQSEVTIYPEYLRTSKERDEIRQRGKKVVTYNILTFPKEFFDEISS